MKPVKLIPYVCGAGGSTAGCEEGPVWAAQAGLAAAIGAQWQEDPSVLIAQSPFGAKFHKALPPLGDLSRQEGVLWHVAHIRDQVEAAIREGVLPVTVGGDHSMAAGSISGLARARQAHGRVGVLWIDAHADINTPDTSPSQALHGMPVAALLGMGHPAFAGLGGGGKPVLTPDHVFYLGLRDIDPGEEEYIRQLGIHAFDREDIQDRGIENAFMTALETVSRETDCLALSIDLDAFDPSETPSVGTPVTDGLRREQTFPVLKSLVQKAHFDLIEIAEFNPTLPGAEETYGFMRDLLRLLIEARN